MKSRRLLIAASIITFGMLAGIVGFTASTTKAADCSTNAVITCGFNTISQLRSKYNSDSPAGVKNIYSYFGMNSTIINSATYKDGYVTKSGDVVVGGKVVAKNAVTAGRHNAPNSTKRTYNGTTFYERTTQNSFVEPTYKVIAFFDSEGRFIGASMNWCGNPIKATNVVVPAPKPVYECKNLAATKISRDEYSFTTTATAANGAKIKSYSYSFGDGKTATSGSTVRHKYAQPGTYTAKVTVTVTVNGKDVTAPGTCTVKVTVAPEMCPVPGKTHLPKDSADCREDKPGVLIEKTVNGSERETVAVNTPFTYELVVKNTGNTPLKNVVVTDKAPKNVTFVSADFGTTTATSWSYTMPELAVGASKTFKITAKLTQYQNGVITNTACVETPTVPGGNPDDCDTADIDTPKPKEPAMIEVCELESKTIVKINEKDFDKEKHSKLVEDCNETPVETPTELPETGLGGVIGGGLGLSALAGAVHYYGASRRNLSRALLNK